jgi:excisionase family DNA binding protein
VTNFRTVPEVAKALRVGPAKIRGLIRAGELRGVNVGAGTKRPRIIIDGDSLTAFLTRRAVLPETPVTRSRRPKLATAVRHFD